MAARTCMSVSYGEIYRRYAQVCLEQQGTPEVDPAEQNFSALQAFLHAKGKRPSVQVEAVRSNGVSRMRDCVKALEVLDTCGFKRSYHQRKFHMAFLAACARAFFKTDEPGAFARNYQKLLDIYGWSSITQVRGESLPGRKLHVRADPNPSTVGNSDQYASKVWKNLLRVPLLRRTPLQLCRCRDQRVQVSLFLFHGRAAVEISVYKSISDLFNSPAPVRGSVRSFSVTLPKCWGYSKKDPTLTTWFVSRPTRLETHHPH